MHKMENSFKKRHSEIWFMRNIYVGVTFRYTYYMYNLYFEVANCYKENLPTQLSGLLLQIANLIIFSGSFQINFSREKNIEADIVFASFLIATMCYVT